MRKLFVILLLSVVLVSGCLGGGGETTQTPEPDVEQRLSVEEIKSTSSSVSYDDLMRNNEDYQGDIINFTGEVIQVQEVGEDRYVLRVATGRSEYLDYTGDVIWVNYEGSRLLEEDIIDVWGRVRGLKTYEAVLGQSVTIPEINALHVEVIEKRGERE